MGLFFTKKENWLRNKCHFDSAYFCIWGRPRHEVLVFITVYTYIRTVRLYLATPQSNNIGNEVKKKYNTKRKFLELIHSVIDSKNVHNFSN